MRCSPCSKQGFRVRGFRVYSDATYFCRGEVVEKIWFNDDNETRCFMSHDDQGWRSEKSQFVAAVAERIRCRRPVDCLILKWCKGPPDLLGLFRWVLVQARIILSACATHPLCYQGKQAPWEKAPKGLY